MLARPSIEGEWTGPRELEISLGFDAFVVSAELGADTSNSSASLCDTTSNQQSYCVTLLDGGVRTEAFALVSSSGSTPVLPATNPLAVSAVLIAPQVPFHDPPSFILLSCPFGQR